MKKQITIAWYALAIASSAYASNGSYSVKDYIREHGAPRLTTHGILNLANKGITSLDGLLDIPGITSMPLERIDLSGNRLTEIEEDSFKGITARNLFLSKNQIETIEEEAFEDATITNLYLQHNQISSLNRKSFEGSINIATLNLEYNKIKRIPIAMLYHLKELISLEIGHNPISTGYFEGNKKVAPMSHEQFMSDLKMDHPYLANRLKVQGLYQKGSWWGYFTGK